MRPTRQLELGSRYKNRYIIDTIIKKGGQAITYLARDRFQDNMKIVLKHTIIPTQSTIKKTMREFKNISSFNHPNIVKGYDCYIEASLQNEFQLYIILQHIDGEDLTKHLGHLSPSQIFKLYNQIKSALQYIHKKGTVHRDVTLGNIILNKNKDAILIDFGIATNINGQPIIVSTNTATENYKPIQFMQEAIVVKQTDLWQFGIVLIQLVTGQSIIKLATMQKYKNPASNKNFPEDVFSKYKVSQQFRSLISPLLRKQYKQRKFCESVIQIKQPIELIKHKKPIKIINIKKSLIEPIKYETVLKLIRATDIQLQSTINQNHRQNLLELDCYNCLLTNESGKTIRLLKKLEKLDITGNNITDQFTYYIDLLLPQLRTLKMAFTNIRNESVQLITKKSILLQQLDISYTLITSTGIMMISKLNKLSSLAIWSDIWYYPPRYEVIINMGGVQAKYRNNQIKINQECIKQLCRLNLTQICMNAEGMEMDELICRMSKQSTCVEVRGRINSKTVEYVYGMDKIERIYLKGIKEGEIKWLKSKQIKSCALVQCQINLNQLIKSLGNYIQLKSLNLSLNNIGAQGAIEIAKNLKNLTSLNLYDNNIGAQGAIEIAKNLKNLTTLDLYDNNIGAQGAIEIAKNLKNLTSLNLQSNKIGDKGAIEIAKNLKNLTSLNLSLNIGAQGAIEIAKNLKNLTSLNLSYNNIGVQGAIEIAKNLKNLTSLNLTLNKIGDKGAIEIAKKLKNLTQLNLYDNNIGAQGAIEIAKNLKNLTSLDLWNNKIGAQGPIEIAKNLKNLTSLNLSSNNIGAQGAIEIAKNLKNLTYLNLTSNNIGAQGAIEIAKNLKNLTSLNLTYNNIGAQGAIEIAKNLKNLTSLNLVNNNIGDKGTIEIAKNLKNLTNLDLYHNNIGEQTQKQIKQYLPNTSLSI